MTHELAHIITMNHLQEYIKTVSVPIGIKKPKDVAEILDRIPDPQALARKAIPFVKQGFRTIFTLPVRSIDRIDVAPGLYQINFTPTPKGFDFKDPAFGFALKRLFSYMRLLSLHLRFLFLYQTSSLSGWE